jgi:aryl-alcohol dehydrogenase-like predicted oxidoreductase
MVPFDRLSRLGIGTYLGGEADADRAYRATIRVAVREGINVVDTAINYRWQRSERIIGKVLTDLAADGVARSSVFISTKGGYLPGDAAFRGSMVEWFDRTFLRKGVVASLREVVAGCHCIAPGYLRHQLRASLRNLGLRRIDLYYIHNPEQQLDEVSRSEFERRLCRAFECLESAVDERRIRCYGLATWNGFRESPRNHHHLDLHRILELAREVGGPRHHLCAIQAPYNAAMTELAAVPNQRGRRTTLEAARERGVAVFASASILQGALAKKKLEAVREYEGTPAQASLQFVVNTPGVTTALVGMKKRVHLRENLKVLGRAHTQRPLAQRDRRLHHIRRHNRDLEGRESVRGEPR